MNTIATLDLLPAARSLTIRVLTAMKRFTTFAARSLGFKLRAALYGAPLTPKKPDALTARTDVVPVDFDGSPISIDSRVQVAVVCAMVLDHVRFTERQPSLEYMAESMCPVFLS